MLPMISPFVVVPFPKAGMSVLIAFLYGIAVNVILKRTPCYVKTDKLNKWAIVVSSLLALLVLIRFAAVMQTIKGLLYLTVLVYASVCDIKTRHITDWASVSVFLIGLIGISEKELIWRLIAFGGMFVFLLLCAVISKNRIGGADIKLVSSTMLVLGLKRGIAGFMTGLLIGTVTTLILSKTKKNKKADKVSMPLVPYLSIGYMGAFFI